MSGNSPNQIDLKLEEKKSFYASSLKGIKLMWNNDFEKAEEIFQQEKDNNPRFALHFAEAVVIRSFITGAEVDIDTAVKRLEKARDLSEEHLKIWEKGFNPRDKRTKLSGTLLMNSLLDCRIVHGESLYLLAVLQFSQDNKLSSVYNLRKSWRVFQGAYKEADKFQKDKNGGNLDGEVMECLRFGVGVFLYAMSILPSAFLTFLKLLGFEADRESGLLFIRECHKQKGIRSPMAALMLLANNLILPRGLMNPTKDLQEAEELVQATLEIFPNSSLFYLMGSLCSRKMLDSDKAILYLEKALSSSQNLKNPPLNYMYELANCYITKMDWKKALELLEPLRKNSAFESQMMAGHLAAACRQFLGDFRATRQIFSEISSNSTKRKKNLENVAISQAKKYLLNGGYFQPFEILYLRRDLPKMLLVLPEMLELLEEHTTRHVPAALSSLPIKQTKMSFSDLTDKFNPFSPKKKIPIDWRYDDRSSYLLIKGALLKSLGKVSDSILMFNEIISIQETVYETYYAAYAWVELAEIHFSRKEYKNCEEAVKKAAKYSDYDWSAPLEVRLKIMQEQLKQVMQANKKKVITVQDVVNIPEDETE